MSETPAARSATVSAELSIGTHKVSLSASVPAGATRLDDLMPLLQTLSDRIVATSEEEATKEGKKISCCKGCGACCRQLVPISPVEARHVVKVIAELPEPRRSVVLERFAAARRRLEESGMWDKLQSRQDWPDEAVQQIGMEYFRMHIACPFLEDESCSIHPQRPMACREYLVTSPAENCANPTPQTVHWLPLPAKIWVAAARCEAGARGDRYLNWVPLIMSLEWVAENPAPPAEASGPDLVRQLLEQLSRPTSLAAMASSTEPSPSPPSDVVA